MSLERIQEDEITRMNRENPAANMGIMQGISPASTIESNIQEKLRQGEERYHALIKATAQIIWIATAEGFVDEDIPSWRSYTGQSETEVKGWGWLDAVHPDNRERVATIWSAALASKNPYETEIRLRRYDGVYHHFLARGVPIFSEDGSVREWIGFCANITELKKVETDAIARARQLEATFEAIADGVIVYDSEGRMQQMNSTAREILAVDAQPDYTTQLLHDRFSLLQERLSAFEVLDEHGAPLPKEQWPVFRILRGEVLKGANAVDIRSRILNGRKVQLSITGSPVLDKDGNIMGAVTIMRDVTERRQLERRTHEALRALLAMAEALVVLPQDAAEVHTQSALMREETVAESIVAKRVAELTRNVLNCQRVGITTIEPETTVLRAMAVVGLSPEQEVQWWAEQQQQESRLSDSTAPELVARLRANEVLQLDMTQPPLNEQPNPYRIQKMLIAPMCVGDQLVGMLSLDHGGIKHEYTAEEMALAGAVAKLAGFVIERERLLREREEARANEIALLESNRRMDEFLSIACHELRTPLAAIKGNVQLAERRLQRLLARDSSAPGQVLSLSPGQQLQTGVATWREKIQIDQLLPGLLENADRQTDRLDRLVSDLLDVSRIQSGKLEMRAEPCDLLSIVQETVQEQRMIASKRSILLEIPVEGPVPVSADADRIEQVLANYLTNALKYSTEDKAVRVSLEVKDSMARVSVHDEGPGLLIAEQEHIWERFHRVQGIEVQTGSGVGLGLGLYISRTIIEWHRGDVGVESTPGKGSIFWFTLPLAEQQDA